MTNSALQLLLFVSSGFLSQADPGVLERVAERRVQWEQVPETWAQYDILIAPIDCSLVGKEGWLLVDQKVFKVLIVDCESPKHNQMRYRRLLADTNFPDLVHQRAWLIVNKESLCH